jgi:hypothetical protein
LLAFFEKYMGWKNTKAEMAKIYTNQFTTEEINKLTEFYQTPLGIKTGKLVPENYRRSSSYKPEENPR